MEERGFFGGGCEGMGGMGGCAWLFFFSGERGGRRLERFEVICFYLGFDIYKGLLCRMEEIIEMEMGLSDLVRVGEKSFRPFFLVCFFSKER